MENIPSWEAKKSSIRYSSNFIKLEFRYRVHNSPAPGQINQILSLPSYLF
jgi:hypothetical protein